MTKDGNNDKWYYDIPVGATSIRMYCDVKGDGYKANDKKDIDTGLITMPANSNTTSFLITNQYSQGTPVPSSTFTPVLTDKGTVTRNQFNSTTSQTSVVNGQTLSSLCANGSAGMQSLLDTFDNLPTFEQNEFRNQTISVYPAPTTMTGGELIDYIRGYLAAHPAPASALIGRSSNVDGTTRVISIIIAVGTIALGAYYFLNKKKIIAA